jgi:hypothetical protein
MNAKDLIGNAMRMWAKRHGLVLSEYEHWDATVQEIVGIDSGGDQYTFYAYSPDEDPSFDTGTVVVGATLRKRAGVKHHAFRRERERFSSKRTVVLAEVEDALDDALAKVLEWVHQAGNDASVGLLGAT